MVHRKLIKYKDYFHGVFIEVNDRVYEVCEECEKKYQIIEGIENISKRRVEISKGIIKEEKERC